MHNSLYSVENHLANYDVINSSQGRVRRIYIDYKLLQGTIVIEVGVYRNCSP